MEQVQMLLQPQQLLEEWGRLRCFLCGLPSVVLPIPRWIERLTWTEELLFQVCWCQRLGKHHYLRANRYGISHFGWTVQLISSFGVFSIEPSAVGSDWCGAVGDRPARLAIAIAAAANSFHCETRWSALLFSLKGLSNLMQCFIIILAEATSGYQKMVAFMEKCLPADEVEEASKPNNEWCCLRRRHWDFSDCISIQLFILP